MLVFVSLWKDCCSARCNGQKSWYLWEAEGRSSYNLWPPFRLFCILEMSEREQTFQVFRRSRGSCRALSAHVITQDRSLRNIWIHVQVSRSKGTHTAASKRQCTSKNSGLIFHLLILKALFTHLRRLRAQRPKWQRPGHWYDTYNRGLWLLQEDNHHHNAFMGHLPYGRRAPGWAEG